ncbi:hypothetical protein AAHE18_08G057100 [Arachis hypogaea]
MNPTITVQLPSLPPRSSDDDRFGGDSLFAIQRDGRGEFSTRDLTKLAVISPSRSGSWLAATDAKLVTAPPLCASLSSDDDNGERTGWLGEAAVRSSTAVVARHGLPPRSDGSATSLSFPLSDLFLSQQRRRWQ